MTQIDELIKVYSRQVTIPWDDHAAPEEKVWFCVYDPSEERRLLKRMDEFELATQKAGLEWFRIDISSIFDEWFASHPYKDQFCSNPTKLKAAEQMFLNHLIEELSSLWDREMASKIIAISGTNSLFGIIRLSKVIDEIVKKLPIPGRLLIFFPGSHRGYCYQFMNDHDGWNYKAIAIEVKEEGE